MRSYIKIWGPPTLKAIKALEKMAIDFPEVCIMNPLILTTSSQTAFQSNYELSNYYFADSGDVPEPRCNTLISKSGSALGDHDFFFEWFKDPDMDQISKLIEKIDETLTPIGVRYTITTK